MKISDIQIRSYIDKEFSNYDELPNRRSQKGGRIFSVIQSKEKNLSFPRRFFEGLALSILTISTVFSALFFSRIRDQWHETFSGKEITPIVINNLSAFKPKSTKAVSSPCSQLDSRGTDVPSRLESSDLKGAASEESLTLGGLKTLSVVTSSLESPDSKGAASEESLTLGESKVLSEESLQLSSQGNRSFSDYLSSLSSNSAVRVIVGRGYAKESPGCLYAGDHSFSDEDISLYESGELSQNYDPYRIDIDSSKNPDAVMNIHDRSAWKSIPDNSVDEIYLELLFPSIGIDSKEALVEISRVLKIGGVLLFDCNSSLEDREAMAQSFSAIKDKEYLVPSSSCTTDSFRRVTVGSSRSKGHSRVKLPLDYVGVSEEDCFNYRNGRSGRFVMCLVNSPMLFMERCHHYRDLYGDDYEGCFSNFSLSTGVDALKKILEGDSSDL
jgi:hypothetical protein